MSCLRREDKVGGQQGDNVFTSDEGEDNKVGGQKGDDALLSDEGEEDKVVGVEGGDLLSQEMKKEKHNVGGQKGDDAFTRRKKRQCWWVVRRRRRQRRAVFLVFFGYMCLSPTHLSTDDRLLAGNSIGVIGVLPNQQCPFFSRQSFHAAKKNCIMQPSRTLSVHLVHVRDFKNRSVV